MTVNAGFCYAALSILIVDSRLSAASNQRLVRRDVGQKLFPLGDKGLIAWSGGLDAARYIMSKLGERNTQAGPWWLLDPDQTRSVLANDFHPGDFPEPKVSLIVQLINPTRRAFEDEDWPRVDMVVIDIEPFDHQVVTFGARVRGSGAYIVPRIDEDELFNAVFSFSSAWPDYEHAVINKCLFAQEIVERLVQEKYEPTIGGMYQIGYLLPDRARTISYERWVCANGDESYGTYITLSVENGHWWQEHKPTKRRSKLFNPFEHSVEREFATDLIFDASLFTPGMPGVSRTPNPLHVSRFLSVHGAAEHLITYTPEPPPGAVLGPEGTFRKIGPNPQVLGARA